MSFARIKLIALSIILALPLNVYTCEDKVIALTFDDGPHYKYTDQILDILKKHDVKATFFTVGENASRFPELIERELSEGHEVANHTYSHRHMKDITGKELEDELQMWEEVMLDHGEYSSRLFRPPEGITTHEERQVIEGLGYDIVMWNIDTRDWAHTAVDKIVENVMKNASDKDIILFHDFVSGKSPTPAALEILIPRLKEQGFRFVKVSDL